MIRRALVVATAGLLGACAASRGGGGRDIIPAFLVGEWATSGAEFANDAITKGGALYLNADGTAMVMGAPPPTSASGTATYVDDSLRLNIRLVRTGRIVGNIYLRYDPSAKTLQTAGTARQTQGSYTRRQNQVPAAVAAMFRDRPPGP